MTNLLVPTNQTVTINALRPHPRYELFDAQCHSGRALALVDDWMRACCFWTKSPGHGWEDLPARISVLWPNNITSDRVRLQGSPYPGCYLVFAAQHRETNLLYVGASGNVFRRLADHCRRNWKNLGRWNQRCSEYDISCDCIPRLLFVVIPDDNPFLLEPRLIVVANPMENIER